MKSYSEQGYLSFLPAQNPVWVGYSRDGEAVEDEDAWQEVNQPEETRIQASFGMCLAHACQLEIHQKFLQSVFH